ncbi:MAG: carbohydrate ABC transporter permease [Prevotella sp.]|nr:carbohydrate ABC transporter permease [Alistipes senegalensis]MCM1357940.1 carbohydrate ABC transporter permease [Prevotella sp.]MCM1473947.1 carbohydrate ABC transporter permease [Muribaculaceae bacterium]
MSGIVGRKKSGDVIIFIFLAVLGAFMFFPVYLTVVMSVKPTEELFVFPPEIYTSRPTLKNFTEMFEAMRQNRVPFSRYVFNSITVTVSVTFLQTIIISMSAFVLAKCQFTGRNLINKIIVISLLYQSNVIYIMQYMVINKLGLIDNLSALILPAIASPVGLFLMKQSISQIPDSIIDSAKTDGAGLFRICWQIVIPNQKPALMTLIIFAFQSSWNMQSGAFVFHEEYKTLPTVVNQISTAGLARAGISMAGAVFMLIPPAVIFTLAQSQIIETMAYSGIKN